MTTKGSNATTIQEYNLTPKQEMYVQGLFKGLSQREAYKQAFDCQNMKNETIDKRACELNAQGKIKGRLQVLQANLAERNTLTVEWVLQNLREVAERCLQAEEVVDRDGNGTGEYKFEHNGANRSLELIGKHLGMFTDKIETKNVNLTDDLSGMTPEQRAERIKELLGKE